MITVVSIALGRIVVAIDRVVSTDRLATAHPLAPAHPLAAADPPYVASPDAGAEATLVLARVLAAIALLCLARLALTVLLAATARAARSTALAEAASLVGGALGRRLVAAIVGAGVLPSFVQLPRTAPAAEPTGTAPPPTAVMRWLDDGTDGRAVADPAPTEPHPSSRVQDPSSQVQVPSARVQAASSADLQDRPTETPGRPPADQTVGQLTEMTWTVRRGEHLWSIAEEFLAEVLGRPPTTSETAAYHRRLIEANRHRLFDPDDPDLVFAGQTFTLPRP
ncbi:MAG: hypothetical protein KatS3mg008_1972 [Acidimicrobiales bacterium]|nr:MAG: hypothetical protein KatS3mg008_1972 [Acidimicrobiales bacterium]